MNNQKFFKNAFYSASVILIAAFVFHSFSIVPNPLISRNKATYTNGSGSTSSATDGNYTSYIGGSSFYVAINLGNTGATRVLFKWEDQYSWNYFRTDCSPGNYTIQISNNSTNGVDGNWTTVATVTNNSVTARSHVFDFDGYSWVKMNITSPASGSSTARIAQIDVHDISNGC